MGILNSKTWTKTNDYYNREIVTCDVYSKKFGRGKVYVMDNKEKGFMFTCSFGASSDYSYTGSFPQNSNINTVEHAMRALDNIVPLQLKDKGKEAREYINSL